MHVHPLSRLMLVSPARVQARLDELERAAVMPQLPNLWQVTLGAMRMWHRMLFRPESVGNCSDHPVRETWRAKLLHMRGPRVFALLGERAIAPWDLTGLFSSKQRVARHLLGAHHEKHQFVYDLEMLSDDPDALSMIRAQAQSVVSGAHPRAEWLQDLVVYEGYHLDLIAALDRALQGDKQLAGSEQDDPDISFLAYLRWCEAQPPTPAATRVAWLDGRYSWAEGLTQKGEPCADSGERIDAREREIHSLSRAALHEAVRLGHPIDARTLDDSEWRGVSLGVPELVDKLAWKTFMKVFSREPQGTLRGWNVRVEQDGVGAPPRARFDRAGRRLSFGHFEVLPACDYDIPGAGSQGLMLDYGRGGNGALDPVSRLRDPVVAPFVDEPDLLLGWSYLQLGPRRVRTPSFFTLRRHGPRSHLAAAPLASSSALGL